MFICCNVRICGFVMHKQTSFWNKKKKEEINNNQIVLILILKGYVIFLGCYLSRPIGPFPKFVDVLEADWKMDDVKRHLQHSDKKKKNKTKKGKINKSFAMCAKFVRNYPKWFVDLAHTRASFWPNQKVLSVLRYLTLDIDLMVCNDHVHIVRLMIYRPNSICHGRSIWFWFCCKEFDD